MSLDKLEYSKQLSVLFVEDEQDARETGAALFGILFSNVYSAKNGKEGIDIFLEKRPDVIITDIQMPIMDGLSMIKEIRKEDPQIPIIVTTAYSDEKYFIESIKLKIDRYILKPISQDECLEAINMVSKRIIDHRNAAEYEKRKIQEKINTTATNTISSIANVYPNPVLVMNENRAIFINDALRGAFPQEMLNGLLDATFCMEKFVDAEGDCSGDIFVSDAINKQQKRTICMKINRGRKIYLVDTKDINIDGYDGQSTLYVFTDVTMLEYQRLKLKNNYERLRELFIIRQQPTAGDVVDENIQNEIDTTKMTKPLLTIEEHEKTLLRKSRNGYRLSAPEYIAEISNDIMDELAELAEVEREMDNGLLLFEEKQSVESLENFLSFLQKYVLIIKRLVEFGDLAYALESLHAFLSSLNNESIKDKGAKKLSSYLSSIRGDLVSWRTDVFVEHSAADIHYLDSSLFSSCLQIQIDLSGSCVIEEEDLDIFF